ncbi:mercury(II) reductase, partial [Candidatus Azambacteria bacterium]|nr:mercury(II) reductase [Candidatus Azambacteria bacterium]
MKTKEQFDLIIIGGGAGAFAAAIRANELGAKTALINSGLPLGGTCVNVGCVPSKTLLYAGEILHHAKHHSIPGVELEVKNFDFQKVVQDELSLVEKLRQEKYEKVLKNLEHVTAIEGTAKFVSGDEIEVDFGGNPAAERSTLRGKKFIIAAGSTATVPPIEGIRDVGFLTHVEALALKTQPKELIVVGAGPLGLEFAQMYARFGTNVTVLQRGPSILPRAEKALADRLQEVLKEEGIMIKTNAEVKSARTSGGKKILSYLARGKPEEVAGDEILLAAGKTPNTKDLGLQKAGVQVDERGAVVVTPALHTSQPHIFAVGDVTNLPLRQEPTAGHEGTLAAENALSGTEKTIDYQSVPWTVFTDPQLAGVGFTEEEQMKHMGVCACRTVSFEDVPKAIIMHRTEGLIKMAIHPQTKQIMGVHILAPNAGELIAEAMML